jgi:hypothetical protein
VRGLTDLAAPAAAASGLLPQDGLRRRLPWRRRRPQGLAGIPERYRLQFLLLAADRAPGRPPAEVAAAADRLAAAVRVPRRLLAQLPRADGLDAWFREHAEAIRALADELAA